MSYRKWILVAVSIFGIGLVLGAVTPMGFASLFAEELASLEQIEGIAPFSFLTVVVIWLNNAFSLLISFILSPIFCLVPILALTVNGWLITFVSVMVMEEESLGFVLAGLLPHGIFEVPAFILGEAAALSFGVMVILALFKKEKRDLLPANLRKNIRYLVVALALLLPAAVIETYITPLLIN